MSLLLLLKNPPVVGSGGNTCTFITSDTSTQGSWMGVYGSQGYQVRDLTSTLPPEITWSEVSNVSEHTWTFATSDVRAIDYTTSRIASTYYTTSSASPAVFDINITDGSTRQLAIYCLDYDGAGGATRRDAIDIADGSTGTVLDSRSVGNNLFTTPTWMVYEISGHVRVNLYCVGGDLGLVSGFFFAPASGGFTPPPSTVRNTTAFFALA